MEKRKVRFEVEQVEQGGWGGGEGKGVDRDCTEMAGRAQGERRESAWRAHGDCTMQCHARATPALEVGALRAPWRPPEALCKLLEDYSMHSVNISWMSS